MNAKGRVFKYGDNVDTDVIIPARYLNIADPKELATHAMEDIDAEFVKKMQPGDIVVFGTHHIGIISDKRNKNGIPYLIHNSGQLRREEDALLSCGEISGHFRLNATRLPDDLAIPFDSPVNTSYRV